MTTEPDSHTARAAALELDSVLSEIAPADGAEPGAVQARLDALTKPPGSLGRLEALACRLAAVYGLPTPRLRRRTVIVMAADHGVADHGVSAYPSAVTAEMCRLFGSERAAVNAIARAGGADVVAVDMGVDAAPGTLPGVLDRKVRRGSRDLAAGPALTRDETLRAVRAGLDLVVERAADSDVFALGDMGIANTTAAAAVTAAFTGQPAAAVVGAGTGVDGDALRRKRAIVERAAGRVDPAADAITTLAMAGGLEIAGLVGVVLGAARTGRAIVMDGFITTAAALAAVRLCPHARGYLFASHRSTEPGHTVQLDALGLDPLLDLGLRLGEGTGAALALPMLDAAAGVLREMATFAEAGVSGPGDGPGAGSDDRSQVPSGRAASDEGAAGG